MIPIGKKLSDHIHWRDERNRRIREQLEATLSSTGASDSKKLKARIGELRSELGALRADPQRFEREFEEKLDNLLRNANLMPYQTRELAREYLESLQIGFRVGRLFPGRRTREEAARRRERFVESVKANAVTYIDIHLRKMFLAHLDMFKIRDERLRQTIYHLSMEIDEHLLKRLVNRGALISREYVLLYASTTAEAIRTLYRKWALATLEEATALLKQNLPRKEKHLQQSIEELSSKLEARTAYDALLLEREQVFLNLYHCLTAPYQIPAGSALAGGAEQPEAFRGRAENFRKKTELVNIGAVAQGLHPVQENDLVMEAQQTQLHPAASTLRAAAEHVRDIPGIGESTARDMDQFARRMEDRTYTIALFGAFSAGKSSFANALLGESVLPVSPNPTTATINRILPPDVDHPHGTAVVRFKSEAQLLKDINQSFELSEQSVDSLEEFRSLIAILQKNDTTEQQNAEEQQQLSHSLKLLTTDNRRFLSAVQKGLPAIYNFLGTEQQLTAHTFQPLVSEEEKACFVEEVTLYYASPLSERGVILVDTPGADSIHARHTQVAFDYIKYADAVVFVTYYNHAFSRADREFLLQLGRVKEQFAADKMFFVVNAADLAGSLEEILDVIAHVNQQLNTFGIRNARIYPVSSHMAVKAKRAGDSLFASGVALFERDFYRFTVNELASLALQNAQRTIDRAVRIVSDWRDSTRLDEADRSSRREQVKAAREQTLNMINSLTWEMDCGFLVQEIDELLYYVKQRVYYRYYDEFKSFVNIPALSNTEESFLVQLTRSTNQIIRFVAFDVAQELRSTSIRIERYIKLVYERIHGNLSEQIGSIDRGFVLPKFNTGDIVAPVFSEGLREVSASKMKDILANYKDRESFFTAEGDQVLRDELDARLREPVQRLLSESRKTIIEVYVTAFKKELLQIKKQAAVYAEQYFTGLLATLSNKADVAALDNMYNRLLHISKNIKS